MYDYVKHRDEAVGWIQDVLIDYEAEEYTTICTIIFDTVASKYPIYKNEIQCFLAAILLYCSKLVGLSYRLSDLVELACGSFTADKLRQVEHIVLRIIWDCNYESFLIL